MHSAPARDVSTRRKVRDPRRDAETFQAETESRRQQVSRRSRDRDVETETISLIARLHLVHELCNKQRYVLFARVRHQYTSCTSQVSIIQLGMTDTPLSQRNRRRKTSALCNMQLQNFYLVLASYQYRTQVLHSLCTKMFRCQLIIGYILFGLRVICLTAPISYSLFHSFITGRQLLLCKPCTNHHRNVCPSVCLLHAGIVSKRRNL